jgi:hypothetical protein
MKLCRDCRPKRQAFYRDGKFESRVHCPCGCCRLRFGLRRCVFEDRKTRQDMGRWRRFRSIRAVKGRARWLAEVKRLRKL